MLFAIVDGWLEIANRALAALKEAVALYGPLIRIDIITCDNTGYFGGGMIVVRYY